jgi:NhaP-type Na+/H+ and K+/H+ antiporter
VTAGRPGAALATAALEGGSAAREVVQFAVASGARATRRALAELDWPVGARLIDVERDGALTDSPRALRAGDVVSVVAPAEQVQALEDLFGPGEADGAMTLDAEATLGDLADYYGVPVPRGVARETSLAAYAAHALRGRAATGDVLVLGPLSLRVLDARGGRVRTFSLTFERR